jgi:taurine--2-oxoglutarate transaminase
MKAVVTACVERGLVVFAPGNRLHVVPPLNIPIDDAKQGLALLDDALEVGDSFCTGR